MNALEALKLAKETGVKVRASVWKPGVYLIREDEIPPDITPGFPAFLKVNGNLPYMPERLLGCELIGRDGNPVEWEVV
jgi:hypothetical protein